MNVLEHPNMEGFKCPICGTNDDKPVVLIPIEGTEVPESRRVKAEQIHIGCIELTIFVLDSAANRRLLAQEL